MSGSRGKRTAPYSVPSRVSTRSSSKNTNDQQPSTSSSNSESNTQRPATVSHMDSHPSSGPSWEDFRKLQESVAEMSNLLKQNMLPREAPNKNSNVNSNGVITNVIPIDSSIPSGSLVQPLNDMSTSNVDRVINEAFQQSEAGHAFNDNTPIAASTTMQATINDYIQSFTGPSTSSGETSYYAPPGKPIDLKVTDRVRQKIWSHEYIELSSLLDPDTDSDNSYTIVSNQGEPLKLSHTKSTKTIQNLGQWCSAFEIFLTIYCRKFPAELPKLMTYMNSVKKLAHRDGDYISYDRDFRYLKQSTNLSWDTVHTTLWLECSIVKALNKRNGKKNNSSSFRRK